MSTVKRIGVLALTAVLLFACVGCGSLEKDKNEPKEENAVYKPFAPLWESDIMYNEPVVLVLDEQTQELKGKLLYEPTEIIEVRNYTLESVFDPSEYTVEGNVFKATKLATAMPYMTEANLRGEGGEFYGYKTRPGTQIAHTEGPGLVMQQVNVTYRHKGEWSVKPTRQVDSLRNVLEKLCNGEDIRLFVYGDSISVGGNSSGLLGIEPHLPPYPKAVKNELEEIFRVKVDLLNRSVGGWRSKEGLAHIHEALAAQMKMGAPDLAILAFGMNDGSLKTPASVYENNMRQIINAIRDCAPSCDIILISTILANPEAPQNTDFTPQYLARDKKIAESVEHVAHVDMMSLSKELYKTKRGVEILANNINHPNDFLVRCYVASIIQTICG